MSLMRADNGTKSGRWKRLGALVLCALFLLCAGTEGAGAKSAFEKACGSFPCPTSDGQLTDKHEQSAAVDQSGFETFLSWLRKILDTFGSIFDSINEYLGEKIPAALEKQAAMSNAGTQGMIEATTRLTGAEIDAMSMQSRVETEMKAASEGWMPEPKEQYLCNKIIACQTPVVMQEFARLVAKMVADGINMRYRDAKDNGDGPQFAFDHLLNKKEKGYGNPADGFNKEDAAPTSSPLSSMADADISVLSLDTGNALQVPQMKTRTITLASGKTVQVNEPDVNAGSTSEKDIAEKKAWIAAVDYCATLAGPRPTPPVGKELDTPGGRTKRAQWEHCASMQSEFVQICANRVGALSRPDCGSDGFEGICEASLHGCNAARDAQMDLPPSFRNCAAGASLYQSEYLCSTMCQTSRENQAGATVGRSHAAMMADMALCRMASNVWKKKIALEEQVFIEAVDAMQNLNSCWPQ